jgi:hypothetical protein
MVPVVDAAVTATLPPVLAAVAAVFPATETVPTTTFPAADAVRETVQPTAAMETHKIGITRRSGMGKTVSGRQILGTQIELWADFLQ